MIRHVVFAATAVVLSLSGIVPGRAESFSADDFLPPVQAQSVEKKAELLTVKNENAVKTETDPVLKKSVTTGASAQDAINRIIGKPKQGCEIIGLSDGGIGFVATGMGTYNSGMHDVVSSRIAQRNAYIEAFMNAKAEMAKTVGGLVIRGATDFDKKIESINDEKQGMVNLEKDLSESQLQTARKVLKGFVTYHVQDAPDKGQVFVTIISTPKTRGKYSRPVPDAIAAKNLRDGLNLLLSEIRSGLVPPVGGRIVEVPETGELAFVGFGSSIVRKHETSDMQAELDLQAEQVAGLRAVDGLLGMIVGDDTLWEGRADEQTRNMIQDFEKRQVEDQTTRGTKEEIHRLDTNVREFRNTLTTGNRVQSIRRGILPPGVTRKTWMDDEEYFAYGIAVYIPSVSNQAAAGSKEMDDAQLLKPVTIPAPGGAQQDVPEQKGQNKAPLEIKRGPSGVVSQDVL